MVRARKARRDAGVEDDFAEDLREDEAEGDADDDGNGGH